MSVEIFSILWILKREGIDESEDIANQMNKVSWGNIPTGRRARIMKGRSSRNFIRTYSGHQAIYPEPVTWFSI